MHATLRALRHRHASHYVPDMPVSPGPSLPSIPPTLAQLPGLQVLNVSFNALQGTLPGVGPTTGGGGRYGLGIGSMVQEVSPTRGKTYVSLVCLFSRVYDAVVLVCCVLYAVCCVLCAVCADACPLPATYLRRRP
jgi:hypothetical protein